MAAAHTVPAAGLACVEVLFEEWLSGTTAVPAAVWPLVFTSLDEQGLEQFGGQLMASLATGKDRILRALEVMPMWIAGRDQEVILRVLGTDGFPDWVRSWVLEQKDQDVAQRLRPVITALPHSYQSTVRDRVGRRPRDEARPIWDEVFGDRR
jgi:hypothetical protein